jgi:cation diffusion facilitator family transporter
MSHVHHQHDHDHDHDHHHHHHHHHHHDSGGIFGIIGAALHLPGFGHDHDHGYTELAADAALHDNALGIRTIWLALLALGITTVLQVIIYLTSGSVALLADTVHNLGDALNSVPLLVAFYLARRAATRRYTYGFGRAEDLAGVLIVVSIAFSAGYILWESVQKLIDPQPLSNLPWVAAAALIGFVGNELVAEMQIRVGKRIGSDAMIADGQHARIDGLTSLAVLIAVLGTAIGLPILDPIVGIIIAIAIVGITWNAITVVWYRLMDAVDPGLIHRMEHYAGDVPGVAQVIDLRARWVGHRLHAELTITVDETLAFVEAHSIAEQVRAVLHRAVPLLHAVHIHIDPRFANKPAADAAVGLAGILPPRYQHQQSSAAPMGAAALKYADDGSVAWNEIWTDFCDLALAGGPPHRGRLLEPVDPAEIAANGDAYQQVYQELERGLHVVTNLPVVPGATPGWIGLVCTNEEMALWLLRAIIVENVMVRREGTTLYFPVGPAFRLEKEIKSIVTVVAKTTHYWQEHIAAAQ